MFNPWERGALLEGDPDKTAGGGGTPPPAKSPLEGFDPAKFKADILKEIKGMMPKPEPKPEPKTEPEPEPKPTPEGGKPEDQRVKALEAKLAAMERQSASDREERKKSEATAREEKRLSQITNSLASAELTAAGRRDAALHLKEAIRYDDAGQLVGPAGEPLGEFVKAFLESPENAHWKPPVPVNGAGATAGRPASGKAANIEDIKPGMSAEDRQRILSQIESATKTLL